jgi:uncharacterized coiled-coil protein SlyX
LTVDKNRSSSEAFIMLAGAATGFLRGLIYRPYERPAARPAAVDAHLEGRLRALETQIAELIACANSAPDAAPVPASPTDIVAPTVTVSREEVDNAVDQALKRFEDKLEQRFSFQERAAETLRAMIAETDRMLERVLEGLNSMADARGEVRQPPEAGSARDSPGVSVSSKNLIQFSDASR